VCDHQRVNAYNRDVLHRLRPELIAVVDGSATSVEDLQGWLATSEQLLEREPEADALKQAFHDGDNECEDLLYATFANDHPGRLQHLAHTLLAQVDAALDH
jgi:hypothetical protein